MTTYYKDGFFNDDFGGYVPDGAIKITDETYRTLLDGQAAGKQIIADGKGSPILVEPQPSPAHEWNGKEWIISSEKMTALLAEKRTQLIDEIDKKAEKIYSVWTRFEAEYKARKDAAEVFKAGGYKGEPSIYITSFAIPAGVDNKTATDIILQQAAGLQKLQDHLAALRMRKYELKHPNLTLEQLQAICDDIIKQMDGLMEAYNNG